MIRLFIAHRKAEEDLDALKSSVESALTASKLSNFTLTLGRDDYEEKFKSAGSWDAWIERIATGIHPITRKAIYDGLVVPDAKVGKATAKMVELALSKKKPVLYLTSDGAVKVVTGVERKDLRNFQSGWELLFS
jgi:hypothetical protein